MKSAKVVLAVAALAFATWIGFLIYLTVTARPTVLLSRPQFLVSQVDVIAKVEGTDGPATVEEVVWTAKDEQVKPGDKLNLSGLSHADGWNGPGRYILALVRVPGGSLHLAGSPRSPGFESQPPRIYPETPETRKQLDEVLKEKTPQAQALPRTLQ